jgi:hypothetical protein
MYLICEFLFSLTLPLFSLSNLEGKEGRKEGRKEKKKNSQFVTIQQYSLFKDDVLTSFQLVTSL